VISAALVAGALGLGLGFVQPVAAQTTSTSPPTTVPAIPVTPAATPAATTTAATTTAAQPLASTGVAADRLVPAGLLLIAIGALLVGASRRYGRPAYSFF
jgi:hypothetical protein